MRCGQTVDLETEDKALLQSHKYFGQWYYPRGQNCTWILEAPAGSTVELFFTRWFDLTRGDWFIVRGEDYYWGSIWQSFAVPFEIGPNETSISFTFSSNTDWKRGWGFRAYAYISKLPTTMEPSSTSTTTITSSATTTAGTASTTTLATTTSAGTANTTTSSATSSTTTGSTVNR